MWKGCKNGTTTAYMKSVEMKITHYVHISYAIVLERCHQILTKIGNGCLSYTPPGHVVIGSIKAWIQVAQEYLIEPLLSFNDIYLTRLVVPHTVAYTNVPVQYSCAMSSHSLNVLDNSYLYTWLAVLWDNRVIVWAVFKLGAFMSHWNRFH